MASRVPWVVVAILVLMQLYMTTNDWDTAQYQTEKENTKVHQVVPPCESTVVSATQNQNSTVSDHTNHTMWPPHETNLSSGSTTIPFNNTHIQTDEKQHNNNNIRQEGRIPLRELVETNPSSLISCRPAKITDIILPESTTHHHRKIPKVVHITSKSRCTSKGFYTNVLSWRLENHTVVYHDDAAVDRLLHKDWNEFPHLQMVLPCLKSGAAKADLWRYLVLWEYGGLYSDIDAGPGKRFHPNIIQPDDDAWFVVERMGIISQYFMAASPRHPLMYLAVMHTLLRLLNVNSVSEQYIPVTTGPGALKAAFSNFMGAKGTDRFHRTPAGHYVGLDNRTVTVVGRRRTSNEFIQRNSVSSQEKGRGFYVMNQTHYSKWKLGSELNISCLEHIYKQSVLGVLAIRTY